MKVDLEELERKAAAAEDRIKTIIQESIRRSASCLGDKVSNQLYASAAKHAAMTIAKDSPPLLALIARIRELEEVVVDGARTIEGWVTCETQYAPREDDPDWKQAEQLRALVTKGVVLP